METRNTVQRELVLNAVRTLGCHPTADQVYEFVSKSNPTISRATVYRNLNRLAETGQLTKCPVTEGADRFDHNLHKHAHGICKSCGNAFDIDLDFSETINGILHSNPEKSHGFEVIGYEMIFNGICPDCNDKL